MPATSKKLEHIAIIMDGNRTWANKKGLPKMLGHTEGAKNLKRVVKAAIHQGIKFLTMYALSTENLKNRSASELKHLFKLFAKLGDYKTLFQENNVKLKAIGNTKQLPKNLQEVLKEMITKTAQNTGLILNLAINYGGRDEIIRALKKATAVNIDLNEESFAKYLDTSGLPDVDLMIRTGGFQRTSNFLPWQATYAELYFTDVRWPDFGEEDLKEAIEWFFEQERKKGK